MSLRRTLVLAAAVAIAGCATGGGAGGKRTGVTQTPVDSATVAMWRFDETTGSRIMDLGPLQIEARAGIDTRSDFGRVRNGRLFSKSIDSFVYVPYRPALDPPGEFTVEAWVYPTAWGDYEIAPLVGRWTERGGEQSWLLGLSGLNVGAFASTPGPNQLKSMLVRGTPGYVVFAFEPREAGAQRTFAAATPLSLERWTHVAVSYDGRIVRFYLNGRQDAQYATTGWIRESAAPLLMGNYFDWRVLSEFGGDLRVEGGDRTPFYAFQGSLDEVRLSNVARTDFPHARD
jgi:hypothetical protein